MALRLARVLPVLGRASQLARPALNLVALASRPCLAATQIPKRIQFGNVQFLGTNFSTLTPGWRNWDKLEISNVTSAGFTDHVSSLLKPSPLMPLNNVQSHRSHIRFSRIQGTQKTVKAAVKRFFRLDSNAWIRTRAGRHKRIYTKGWKKRKVLKWHVFVNNTQKGLLNHMVTKFWKKPKYYVDDPYEPYHVRHDVHKVSTRDVY